MNQFTETTTPFKLVGGAGADDVLPENWKAPRFQAPSDPGRGLPTKSTLYGAVSAWPPVQLASWLAKVKTAFGQLVKGLGAPVGMTISVELVPDLGFPEFR